MGAKSNKIIFLSIIFLSQIVFADLNLTYLGEVNYPASKEFTNLYVDNVGRIYLSQNGKKTIHVYNKFGSHIDSIILEGNSYFLKGGDFSVDKSGNIIVVDVFQNSLTKFSPEGKIKFALKKEGESNAFFRFPKSVAIDKNDNILVADTGNQRIQIFNKEGVYLGSILSGDNLTSASSDLRLLQSENFSGNPIPKKPIISSPVAISRSKNNIFVLDLSSRFVFIYNNKYEYMGNINLSNINEIKNISPNDLATYKNSIFILDKTDHNVKVFDIKGPFLNEIGSKGTGRGQFFHPLSINISNDKMYILDKGNNRVQIFSLSKETTITDANREAKPKIVLFKITLPNYLNEEQPSNQIQKTLYHHLKKSEHFQLFTEEDLSKILTTQDLNFSDINTISDTKNIKDKINADLGLLGKITTEDQNTYSINLKLFTLKTSTIVLEINTQINKNNLTKEVTDLIINLERDYFNQLGAPSKVVNLTSSSTHDSVFLRWNENPEEDVIGYSIYYSNYEDQEYKKVGETSNHQYEFKRLSLDKNNYFQITALDSEGKESLSSKIIEANPSVTPDFGFILNIKRKSYPKGVYFEWTNPEKEKIHEYQIYRSNNLNDEYLLIGTSRKQQYQETGLEDGKEYFYKIKKVYVNGLLSPFSNSFSCSTVQKPSIIQGLKAASNLPKKIILEWNIIENNKDIKNIIIYRSTSNEGRFLEVAKLSKRKNKFEDTELKDNSPYYYKVKAIDKFGLESDYSNEVFATTKDIPITPFNLKISKNLPRRVKLNWDHSKKEMPTCKFIIYRSDSINGAFDKIALVNKKEYTDINLQDNTQYYYFVCAKDLDNLISKPSEIAQSITKQHPMPPQAVKSLTPQPKMVTIVWNKSSNPDVVKYNIYRSKKFDGKFHLIGTTTPPLFKDTNNEKGLKNGATYYYKVESIDNDNLKSALSNSVIGKTKNPPSAPIDVVAEIRDNALVLSWPPVPGDNIFGYAIYKNRKKIKVVKSNLFVDNNVKKGKKYSYRITAVDNSNLESPKSRKVALRFKNN